MIRPPRLTVFVVCMLVAAAPRVAFAASKKDEARSEFDRGEIQYKLGRFQKALEAYTRAYEIYPAASLLFDIGQCHRNLKHYDRAIFFFEGYLREASNPSRRRLAQQLIDELRAEMEKKRAAIATVPPPEPVAPPAAALTAVEPRAEARAATTLVATPVRADAEPAPKPVTRRWWFWTAIGAGALAVATGLFVYYESGTTTTGLPGGTVGTLDRR
jgi:tetratricopeptide (TPR) repeat protein